MHLFGSTYYAQSGIRGMCLILNSYLNYEIKRVIE